MFELNCFDSLVKFHRTFGIFGFSFAPPLLRDRAALVFEENVLFSFRYCFVRSSLEILFSSFRFQLSFCSSLVVLAPRRGGERVTCVCSALGDPQRSLSHVGARNGSHMCTRPLASSELSEPAVEIYTLSSSVKEMRER